MTPIGEILFGCHIKVQTVFVVLGFEYHHIDVLFCPVFNSCVLYWSQRWEYYGLGHQV